MIIVRITLADVLRSMGGWHAGTALVHGTLACGEVVLALQAAPDVGRLYALLALWSVATVVVMVMMARQHLILDLHRRAIESYREELGRADTPLLITIETKP